MESMQAFMQEWEEYLNRDPILKKRNNNYKSTISEGEAIVEVEVEGRGLLTVELVGERLKVRPDKAAHAILSWSVPLPLFKEVLLGSEKLLFALVDGRCKLSFHTPRFTHWNGTTALAVILAAQEMVKRSPEARSLLEAL